MEKLFLDANILFSAAYKEKAALLVLWKLKNVELITSPYAIEEAERNLASQLQRARLSELIKKMTIVHAPVLFNNNPYSVKEKDLPILQAAIFSKSDYLITGDFQDFGRFFGKKVERVMILPPAVYLKKNGKK